VKQNVRYDNYLTRFYNYHNHCFVNDDGGNDDGGGGNDDDEPTGDLEAIKLALKNARKLERNAVRERDALKREKDERDNASKTELEKAQSKAAELEAKIREYETKEREATVSNAIAETAKKLGAIYPDDVYALVKNKVDVDDSGSVKNAERVVKELRETRPALFNEVDVDQNARNNNRSEKPSTSMDMSNQIRRATGRV
jgi:hypothetical protein